MGGSITMGSAFLDWKRVDSVVEGVERVSSDRKRERSVSR